MVEKENDIAVPVAASITTVKSNNNADNIVNGPINKTTEDEDLKGLAVQFLTAYYTKLSDNPNEIGIFYGDDSSIVLGDVEENGRENIQRVIEKMNLGDCKSRFYSVKGAKIGDGKVFQVCGELILKDYPVPRRFLQTIVLSPMPPNVLYVKTNIFQWLDSVFPVITTDKVSFHTPLIQKIAVNPNPVENGNGSTLVNNKMSSEKLLLNGGALSHYSQTTNANITTTAIPPNEPQPISQKQQSGNDHGLSNDTVSTKQYSSVDKQIEEQPIVQTADMTQNPVSNVEIRNLELDSNDKKSFNNINSNANEPEEEAPPQKEQKEKQELKSWNKVVSSGMQQKQQPISVQNKPVTITSGQPTVTKSSPQPSPPLGGNENICNNTYQVTQQQDSIVPMAPFKEKRSSAAATDDTNNSGFPNLAPRKEWPYRIYFNNLPKPGRFVDFRRGQQELMDEILCITNGVEFVGIKPISLRSEYKKAFGFIDFTTAKDMQAVYDACKKDADRGNFRLKVKIPEFDYDGFISMTTDKTSNLGGGGGVRAAGGNANVNGGTFYNRGGGGQ